MTGDAKPHELSAKSTPCNNMIERVCVCMYVGICVCVCVCVYMTDKPVMTKARPNDFLAAFQVVAILVDRAER